MHGNTVGHNYTFIFYLFCLTLSSSPSISLDYMITVGSYEYCWIYCLGAVSLTPAVCATSCMQWPSRNIILFYCIAYFKWL